METTTIILPQFHQIRLTHLKGLVTIDFWDNIPHSHEHCEIFLHLKGTLDVFVEQNLYSLQGGEVRLYRSDELHYGRADSPQHMEWYQISIPREYLDTPTNRSLAAILFDRNAGTGNVFTTHHQQEMIRLIAEAFHSHEIGNPLWPHYCESTVVKILCLLNERQHHIQISVQPSHALQQMIDIISSDFQSLRTLQDLCDATHYSPSYIHKLFQENLHISPYQFLMDKKLNEAKKALKEGLSVTEACEYAGFHNYSNFITLFRKKFHTTPKKYQVL